MVWQEEEVTFDPNQESRLNLYERMIKLLDKIEELEAQNSKLAEELDKAKNKPFFPDLEKFKDLFPDPVPAPIPDIEYWKNVPNWYVGTKITYADIETYPSITTKYFTNNLTIPS